MTKLFSDDHMKPILILPPHAVSDDDIKKLNDNGLCTVVAKDPGAVKFLDPIPSTAQRGKIEQAAIELSRRILSNQANYANRTDILTTYVSILVAGTPLDPRQSQEERDQKIFDMTKDEEIRRLARVEAKEERAAIKAKKITEAKK